MIKNIRKAVSIICVAALLMSLCVVSFIGGASAAPITQTDNMTLIPVDEKLSLTFDDSKGIVGHIGGSGVSAGTWPTVQGQGTVFPVISKGASTYRYILGKDNEQGVGGTAFSFEAGKTYSLTFKVALAVGSYVPEATSALTLYMFPGKGATYNTSSVKEIKPGNRRLTLSLTGNHIKTEGGKKIVEDIVWQEFSYQFTPSAYSDYTDWISFAISGVANGDYVAYFDDFVFSECQSGYSNFNNKYVFDWKTGDTPIDTAAVASSINSNSSYAQYIFSGLGVTHEDTVATAEGLRFSFASSGAFGLNGNAGWNNKVVVYDKDASDTGRLKFKTDTTYVFTAKYKVIDMGENSSVGLAIYAGSAASRAYGFCSATHTGVTADWQYLTTVIDTNDSRYKDYLLGSYNELYLAANGNKAGQAYILVESVEVQEVRDTKNGVAVVETVVDGKSTYTALPAGTKCPLNAPHNDTPEDRGFAGWATEDGKVIENPNEYVAVKGHNVLKATWDAIFVRVTYVDGNKTSEPVRLKVGIDLDVPTTRPDPYLFFQNWVDAEGNVYTKVPGENITLYAKYNGAYMTFDNVYCGEGTTVNMDIAADPDNAKNSVLRVDGYKSQQKFTVAEGDFYGAKAFRLKTNTTYGYTFKYKVVGSESGFSITLARGESKTISAYTVIPEAPVITTKPDTDGWVTVVGSFTTGDSHYLERDNWYYQDKVIFIVNSKTGALYIDDLLIAEELTEAPKGTVGISFETNGPEIATVYGYPGETFVPTNAILNGSDKVVGWYTDKRLATKFDNKFPAKDITLYAKWSNDPMVMDVEKYNTSKGTSAFFKIEETDGNHYLHYNSSFSTGSTAVFNSCSINYDSLYYRVTHGVEYQVTFKYKLVSGSVEIGPVYYTSDFRWTNELRQQGNALVTLATTSDDWQTKTVTFTVRCEPDRNFLNFGVKGVGECYFDDIIVVATANTKNIYGSTVYKFETNGGKNVDPISGDPGDEIGKLPVPTRPGYQFDAWYTDINLNIKFNGKTFGEKGMTLYAGWILGKFTESFEDFPDALIAAGSGYQVYNSQNVADFDKKNVQNGASSIYRNGNVNGTKAMGLCRAEGLDITVGKQYTVTFYVKPTNVTQPDGTISLLNVSKFDSGFDTPTSTEVLKKLGDLKTGEWQRVSYTFTATDKYLALSTTDGNDMYFDNITVTLKGYTGTTTGDSSVSPLLIVMMIIIAAGALTITGKKVFEK